MYIIEKNSVAMDTICDLQLYWFNHNTFIYQNKMNKDIYNKKGFKQLDFVVFDTISHHIMNKCYEWCYIKIVFTKHFYHTFYEIPTADPELSYVNQAKIYVSACHIEVGQNQKDFKYFGHC